MIYSFVIITPYFQDVFFPVVLWEINITDDTTTEISHTDNVASPEKQEIVNWGALLVLNGLWDEPTLDNVQTPIFRITSAIPLFLSTESTQIFQELSDTHNWISSKPELKPVFKRYI